MSTLGGVAIADNNSPFDSGVAFLLAQKCEISETVQLSSGQEIEVRKDSPYVVARITGASDANIAFNKGYDAIQQGLDVLSITGKADFSVKSASDEHIIWWRPTSKQVLRVVTISKLPVTMGSPTLTVRDAQGNLIPPPPVPALVYHESLRYFRLSQVTEDLFDAFRNMYLAFELLLEYIAPIQPGEKEGAWLRKALTTANNTVPLSRVYTAANQNIIDDIYKNIYVNVRCALFHAKKTSRLLPHQLADKKIVEEGLYKLSRLVLLLSEHWLYARRSSGLLTYVGFDRMTKPFLSNSFILVSDNDAPLNKNDSLEDTTFSNAIPMKTREAPELSSSGLNSVLGIIDTAELYSLSKIARFGLVHDNTLMIGATVEAELIVQATDILEVQVGIQLENLKQPKHFFKA